MPLTTENWDFEMSSCELYGQFYSPCPPSIVSNSLSSECDSPPYATTDALLCIRHITTPHIPGTCVWPPPTDELHNYSNWSVLESHEPYWSWAERIGNWTENVQMDCFRACSCTSCLESSCVSNIIIIQRWETLLPPTNNASTAGMPSSKHSKIKTSDSSKSTAKNKSISTMSWSSNADYPPHNSHTPVKKSKTSEEVTLLKTMLPFYALWTLKKCRVSLAWFRWDVLRQCFENLYGVSQYYP